MRSAAISFLVAFGLGLSGLVVAGLTQKSGLVYSAGTTPAAPVAAVGAGQRICQGPISVPDGASFDRVAFTVGTYQRTGPELRVDIVDADGGHRIAGGELPAGYPDIAQAPSHTVRVGRVETAKTLRICIEDAGDRKIALYGQLGIASPRTNATLDGRPLPTDIAIMLRRESRSLLSLLPTMAERAGLFRAGWVTPVIYLVLALLLLAGVPLLLARALRRTGA